MPSSSKHPVCMAAILAVAATAGTAGAGDLTAHFDYRIVEIDDAGKQVLVERKTVRPGETIHYMITHTNQTGDAVGGLVVSGPVPDEVTFDPGSQDSSLPATFEVQAELDPERDGLEWSTLPAERKVLAEDGTSRVEPLPDTEIVAVRWSIEAPLPDGEEALNSYSVIVN